MFIKRKSSCVGYVGRSRSCGLALGLIGLIALFPDVGFGQKAIERPFADQIAKQKGWLIRAELADLRVIELNKIRNGIPLYYSTMNRNAAISVNADDAWPGGSAGLSLNGSGVRLGIWDGGRVRTTHQEFGGRAAQQDGSPPLSGHSTHVAGTMIGAGLSPGGAFPAGHSRGMSFAATLHSYDFNNDESEMRTASANGLLVSNHSYGLITGWTFGDFGAGSGWYWFGDATVSPVEDYFFGFYSFQSESWDEIAYEHPYYLIVKAAGNDRNEGPSPGSGHFVQVNGVWTFSTITRNRDGNSGYDSIGHAGVSKNILTVGAVNDVIGGYSSPAGVSLASFSCFGPADDSRIKPDIVANGVDLYSSLSGSNSDYGNISGTSMSSPNASGSLGLLIQHYRATHSGEDMRAATLKGLAIHTANECGASAGPDYAFGWGLLNVTGATGVITHDAVEPGVIQELVEFDGISQVWTYSGSGSIKATISWTDPAGTEPAAAVDPLSKALVNDLDLRLIGPGGAIHEPWRLVASSPTAAATTGDNVSDNVEVVSIASPPAGNYTVQITHKGGLAGNFQHVSLILSGLINGPAVDGACCDGETCTGTMDEVGCAAIVDATWYGGTDCGVFTCPPLAACCTGCPPSTVCADRTQAECSSLGGRWAEGETCASFTCSVEGNACATEIISVTDGTYGFDNLCASTDGPSPVNCENGSQVFGNDMWYSYTASCSGTLTVSLCSGTGFDAIMAMYTSNNSTCPCPTNASLQMGTGGDDSCGVGGGPPELVRDVVQGRCYTIRIGGWDGSRGVGEFSIHCEADLPAAPSPASIPLDKNRFISLVPGNAGTSTALRVTLGSLHHPDPANLPGFPPQDFSSLEGEVRWAGAPIEVCESGGLPPCGVSGDATYMASTLQCGPFYSDWSALLTGETLHIGGPEILPSSVYDVAAVSSSCLGIEETCPTVSPPIVLGTARWGDVAEPYQLPSPAGLNQPSISDVAAIIDKFKALSGAASQVEIRLQPASLTLAGGVNIADVASCVDAFKNLAYPYSIPGGCGGQ